MIFKKPFKTFMIGIFTVDILSKKATTRLEVLGEDMHIIWDGHNDNLYAFGMKTNCMRSILTYENTECRDEYSDNIIVLKPLILLVF